MATKNRRIPVTATGQPAVESPKRVPDRQTGQASFILGGQYAITAHYVNPRSVFRQSWTLPRSGRGRGFLHFYITWLSLDLPRDSEFIEP